MVYIKLNKTLFLKLKVLKVASFFYFFIKLLITKYILWERNVEEMLKTSKLTFWYFIF